MSACKFFADTEQKVPSILYDDLWQLLGDADHAELVWRQVRTPSFKDFFGDWQKDRANASTAVDTNGDHAEPKLIVIQHEGYFRDSRTDNLMSLQEILTQRNAELANKRETDLRRASDAVVEKLQKARYIADRQGKTVSVTQIDQILEELKRAEVSPEAMRAALLRFVRYANEQVYPLNSQLQELQARFELPGRTPDDLRQDVQTLGTLTERLYAFEALQEAGQHILGGVLNDADRFRFSQLTDEDGLPLSAHISASVDRRFCDQFVAPIVKRIADARALHQKLLTPILAEFLMQYNRNPDLTRQQLQNMLTQATGDLTFTQRWLNAMAGSPDQVLALAAESVSKVRGSTHRFVTRFTNQTWLPLVEELTAYQKAQGIDVSDPEQLYGFMLERIEDLGDPDQQAEWYQKIYGTDDYAENGIDPKALTGRYYDPQMMQKRVSPDHIYARFNAVFYGAYQSAQDTLPAHHKRGRGFIAILKSGDELVADAARKSVGEGLKQRGRNWRDSYLRQAEQSEIIEKIFDEDHREYRHLRLNAARQVGGTKGISPNSVSLDLASNLPRFLTQVQNFTGMLEILPYLEGLGQALGERTLDMPDSSSRQIIDKATGKAGLVKGPTHAADRYEDWMKMVVYGVMQEDEGTVGKSNVDWRKVCNRLAGLTSSLQLGLNLYSGVNNLVIGHMSNFIESGGGQFYTRSEYAKAKLEYNKLLFSGELLTDYSSQVPTTMLAQFLYEFDIFQEEQPDGSLLKQKGILQQQGWHSIFFFQKSGEHAIQSQLTLSMLHSHRVHKQKILSFDDWVRQENRKGDKADRKAFEELPTLHSQLLAGKGALDIDTGKLDPDELLRFAERIKALYQKLHGNYAQRDTPAMNRYGVLRLVGLFRRYLKPAWDRRWENDTYGGEWEVFPEGHEDAGERTGKFIPHDRFNQRLGANSGGMYTVTYRFLQQLTRQYKEAGFALSMIGDEYQKLPRWRQHAIQATLHEAAVAAFLTSLIAAIGAAIGDDDDNWLANFGYYQVIRARQDVLAYVSPSAMWNTLRAPMATISVFEKVSRTIGQAIPFYGYDTYATGPNAGKLKLGVYIQQLVPLWSQVDRITDPAQQAGWLLK